VYKNVIGNALQDGESLKTETCWSDIIESSSGVGEFGLTRFLAYDGSYLKRLNAVTSFVS